MPRPIFDPFPTPNTSMMLMAKAAMITSRAFPEGTKNVSKNEVTTSPSSRRE